MPLRFPRPFTSRGKPCTRVSETQNVLPAVVELQLHTWQQFVTKKPILEVCHSPLILPRTLYIMQSSESTFCWIFSLKSSHNCRTLHFFPFRSAVPFGVPDAGWHHLREGTGANTSKEKTFSWSKYQHQQFCCFRKRDSCDTKAASSGWWNHWRVMPAGRVEKKTSVI